jgi:hypothetical protein
MSFGSTPWVRISLTELELSQKCYWDQFCESSNSVSEKTCCACKGFGAQNLSAFAQKLSAATGFPSVEKFNHFEFNYFDFLIPTCQDTNF